MRAHVLPLSTPCSDSNSTNNSEISFSYSTASTTASAPSPVALNSLSSASPPSAPFTSPAPFDSTASSLFWPRSPSPLPACAGASSLPPTAEQPSASTQSSTAPLPARSPTGITTASLLSPGASGVVVVGVVGRVEPEVSQFLDRLLDTQVFGVKNRARETWQESSERFVSTSDLDGGVTRERKQRKDGQRIRVTEIPEGVVFDREGLGTRFSSSDDIGQKSGSRTGKCHIKNGHYGRRLDEVEGGRYDRRHGAGTEESSSTTKEVQLETISGRGRDEESQEVRGDGCKDRQWNVPWLLSKLKYHHDVENGTVYLQFTWGVLPSDCLREGSLKQAVANDGLFATMENDEADGMRGLLFMFSVCHVVMLVQEGASFNPHLLRVFRLLQTAKHSLAPFVKTQVLPGLLPPPSSAVRPSPSKPVPQGTRHPFGRGGAASQNSSFPVALMSGSTPVLIPGQCTPVVLFVYLEDVAEPNGGLSPPVMARTEETPELSLSAFFQAGPVAFPTNYLLRQNPHERLPSSEAASSRTNKKSEPGMRKKLQAALEAQIRFLLKKCRTVAGLGDSTPIGPGVAPGMGPRGPGSSVSSYQGTGGSGALFALDPSRAVILLDREANYQTDALDAATNAIEVMLCGQDGLMDILWDVGSSSTTPLEDIQAVKDFLWRQAEILRGKGGISGNTGGGGTGGVGMVAAAAAAAAASAASGLAGGTNKPISTPPELPTFSSWLSACRVLAEALSARLAEDSERDAYQNIADWTNSVTKKGGVSPTRTSVSTGKYVKPKPTIESSLECLNTVSNLDLKFSVAWCERVLPSAIDVYLKGLPSSYPTSLHKSQLEKSLRFFHSKVRGHAVPLYRVKLKEMCEAVWQLGRQLCDATSLTGKPCIHQVHDVIDVVSIHVSNDRVTDGSRKEVYEKIFSKPHSSGVVFLHACACGRSRKLRKDPFDFESANVTFSRFSNCEELLVTPIPSKRVSSAHSPWTMVRLGMSRYYQPEMGLVQSGFIPRQNFLSYMDIPLVYSTTERQVGTLVVPPRKEEVAQPVSSGGAKPYLDQKITNTLLLQDTKPVLDTEFTSPNLHGRVLEKGYVDNNTTGGGSTISDARKGFTEGTSKANYGGESAFPPLPEKLDKPPVAIAKLPRHQNGKERKSRKSVAQDESAAPSTLSTDNMARRSQPKLGTNFDAEQELLIKRRLATNTSQLSLSSITNHVRLYIGFEYECPHGHRFLLSNNQPERLTSSNSSLKSAPGPSSKHRTHARSDLQVKESSSLTGTLCSLPTIQETFGNLTGGPSTFPPKWSPKRMDIPGKMQYWSVQDGEIDGRALLNSSLPIYMHCPYCKTSVNASNPNKRVTFGGTISQLQRVFLVTPSLPLQLASCPVVEFEDSSKPAKKILKFNPGSEMVLPPDSFLSLRLPFVYYSQLEGEPHTPLLVNQEQPEQCAWLLKNTALYVLSKGGMIEPTMSGFAG